MHTAYPSTEWSTAKKVAFRFIFVFFTLIIFPFPLTLVPFVSKLGDLYQKISAPLVQWVGNNLLGIEGEITTRQTGSGDMLYDWVLYATVIFLTLVIGLLFSFVDRKRKNYNVLKKWFLLILSYYLAYTLLSYGIIKLFHLQFSPPSLSRLFETYGQSSPMRLMWTFMGASATYTIFAGFAETLAGALLLFRRTRLVGAFAAFGVMFNVFMMNMSYDIPVKLFSFQLCVISLYLIAQHGQRLFTFFFTDRAVPPPVKDPITQSKIGWWVVLAVQVIFAGVVIIGQIVGGVQGREQYGSEREKSPLYGVYDVEHFIQNGDTLPDLLSDAVRWKRVLFDYPDFTQIRRMKDQPLSLTTEMDTTQQTILFTERGEDQEADLFTYELKGRRLLLKGTFRTDTLEVHLIQYDLSKFGLLNRGFHWVNEVPYNRYNYEQ